MFNLESINFELAALLMFKFGLPQVIQDCNWNIEANEIDKNVLKIYVIDYF